MTTLNITPLDNLLPMQLEDARIVLQYWLAQGQFHADDDTLEPIYSCDVGFFYDQRMLFSEHDYYQHVRDRMVLYVSHTEVSAETFDEVHMSNMEFINEVGMWAVAMTTLNRALPVTLDDADERDNVFFNLVQHGYEDCFPRYVYLDDLANRFWHEAQKILDEVEPDPTNPASYEVRHGNEIWRNGHPFFTIDADQMDIEHEEDLTHALVKLMNDNPTFW